ncbi:MAG: hypothetical protein ACTSQ0_09280 [Candidatus Heimdallarchaeota archaeon]
MNKAVYYKYLFLIAGLLNIIFVVIFALLTLTVSSFLPFFGLSTLYAEVGFWMYGFLLLSGIIGFNYFLVGLDFTKNHLVISSGMISKTTSFFLILAFFLYGTFDWPLLVLGAIQLIFVGLFIEFFVNYKKLLASDIGGAYNYRKNS